MGEPTIVFVASDVHSMHPDQRVYQDYLRYAIHSVREVCKWSGRIVVLDCGLRAAQADALGAAGVRTVRVNQELLPQPYMWKIYAEKLVTTADPLIVVDADMEFRAPLVIEELLGIAREKVFAVEEVSTWHASPHMLAELGQCRGDMVLAAMEMAETLADRPVINAGLFGGPRRLLCGVLRNCRILSIGLQQVFSWFWEQLALSYWLRQPCYRQDVALLDARHYNWLTAWGVNPQAKVLHFHRNLGADQRAAMPDDYLRPRLNRMLRPAQPSGTDVRGAKLLVVPCPEQTR